MRPRLSLLGGTSRSLILASLLGVAAGCADKGATAVVVAVSTEGAVPDDINRLRIVVTRGGRSPTLEPYELPTGAKLPGTITLKPLDEDDIGGPIKVSVEGYLRAPGGEEKKRVLRSATLTFVSEKQKLLRMPLRFACFDADDCDDGKTCIGGECLPDTREAAVLPDFEERLVVAAGDGCFDERKCLAAGAAVPVTLAPGSCSFDAPGPAGSFNLAMEWAAAPGSAVLLEQDPGEGFTLDGGKVTLAPGLCKALQSKRALAIFSSVSCAAKTPEQALCEVAPGPLPQNAIGGNWSINGPEGAQIVGPPGALSDLSSLKIEVDTGTAPSLPGSFQPRGKIFAFLPHGQTFAQPVTIRVPFDMVAQSAPVLLTAPPGGSWEVVPGTTTEANTLSGAVDHFSFFVVAEEAPSLCPHSACTEGVALDPSCGACEAQICGVIPACCSDAWSSECVGLTIQFPNCDPTCGAGGAGGSAGAGGAAGEGGAGGSAGEGGAAGSGGNSCINGTPACNVFDACKVQSSLPPGSGCEEIQKDICGDPSFAYCCSSSWDGMCAEFFASTLNYCSSVVNAEYITESLQPEGAPFTVDSSGSVYMADELFRQYDPSCPEQVLALNAPLVTVPPVGLVVDPEDGKLIWFDTDGKWFQMSASGGWNPAPFLDIGSRKVTGMTTSGKTLVFGTESDIGTFRMEACTLPDCLDRGESPISEPARKIAVSDGWIYFTPAIDGGEGQLLACLLDTKAGCLQPPIPAIQGFLEIYAVAALDSQLFLALQLPEQFSPNLERFSCSGGTCTQGESIVSNEPITRLAVDPLNKKLYYRGTRNLGSRIYRVTP